MNLYAVNPLMIIICNLFGYKCKFSLECMTVLCKFITSALHCITLPYADYFLFIMYSYLLLFLKKVVSLILSYLHQQLFLFEKPSSRLSRWNWKIELSAQVFVISV